MENNSNQDMELKQFLAQSAPMEADGRLIRKVMSELPERDSSFGIVLKTVCYVLASTAFFLSGGVSWAKTMVSWLLPVRLTMFQMSLALALVFSVAVLALLTALINNSDD